MNVFKQLFKNSKKSNKKPNLEKLLNSDDINNSIIELDDYISKLCSWGFDLSKLNEEQKNFYFNQNLEREINNGGLIQYFLNSSGDNSHETVISLRAIGAIKTANILLESIAQFPNAMVPKERTVRQESIMEILENASKVWKIQTHRFLSYEEDLNSLNIEYIQKNENKF